MRVTKRLNLEDRQTVPLKVQRKMQSQWSKMRCGLIGCLLFLFLASSTSAVTGYLAYHTYQTDLLLAQMGMQHMRSAMTLLESLQTQPFVPRIVERAQQEFAAALNDAQALKSSLTDFSGIADFTPIYSTRLIDAIRLSALAIDISQSGISGCEMLELVLTHMALPLNVSTLRLTNADFIAISNQYQTVKASLNGAMNEAMLLQPGDVSFDAHLIKLLKEFKGNIPVIRTLLSEMDRLLPVLPTLLGINTPSHFLLEILDSTELRPGGGFIGNYGIATFSGARLTAAHITDVYLLDKPFEFAGHSLPFPPSYQWFAYYLTLSSWSLRDSNLDADFPTDARYGELTYQREGGSIPLQGVIAITPLFIEHVLDMTGPISVPEYHETVTAQNLVSLIHFHQLGEQGSDTIPSPDGRSSQRKYFTELLGVNLLARVQQLAPGNVTKFLQLVFSSLLAKDTQIYFNASGAENTLHLLHLDGTIQSPTGDHLFIVDANIAANKANGFIISTVDDQVIIDKNGNAVHHTNITYAWTLSGQNFGNQLYQDYVRVYVPLGSTLSQQNGWHLLDTSTAFDSLVWAGFFTLAYKQTHTITLLWISHGVAKSGTNNWHYQYLLQRQAGIQRALELQIVLPLCADVTNEWGGIVSNTKQKETLAQPLLHDLNVGVDYVCN